MGLQGLQRGVFFVLLVADALFLPCLISQDAEEAVAQLNGREILFVHARPRLVNECVEN